MTQIEDFDRDFEENVVRSMEPVAEPREPDVRTSASLLFMSHLLLTAPLPRIHSSSSPTFDPVLKPHAMKGERISFGPRPAVVAISSSVQLFSSREHREDFLHARLPRFGPFRALQPPSDGIGICPVEGFEEGSGLLVL